MTSVLEDFTMGAALPFSVGYSIKRTRPEVISSV